MTFGNSRVNRLIPLFFGREKWLEPAAPQGSLTENA